jgi:hypothetical protein
VSGVEIRDAMRQDRGVPLANASDVQAGRERKKAAGGRLGGPAPYGYRWHRGELVPVTDEQHVIWLARHLYTECGWSLSRIADAFLGLRIRPRAGDRWRRDALHRIIRAVPADRADALLQQHIPDTG